MDKIINIAVVAHVDAGKSTLVDALLEQNGAFGERDQIVDCVMDSNDIERERGITIYSKNCSIRYKDYKINIVDTPGHADFSSEVERVIKTVDTVILLVDSSEGPMPQTRFVLKKALEHNLRPILFINKIDKKDARPEEVVNMTFDLFCELNATDEQLDFPIIYASAREGFARYNVEDTNDGMEPLFKTIIDHVEPPKGYIDGPFQMLVTTLDSNAFVGKIAIGKVHRGTVKKNQNVTLVRQDGTKSNYKITAVFGYNGLKREEVEEAGLGDIIAVSGIMDANIGETIADASNPEALPFVEIDEPTLNMNFMVNDSPFAGKEGEFVTSRHLRDRLMKELETNVSLRVREITPDCFEVSGRGELHLSVLIETMRREGFELQVSKPSVIFKEENGKKLEPMEYLTIDVPEEFMGAVMEKMGPRKAEMVNMTSAVNGYTRLEFSIPARGLIGFRNEFMTDTKGNGIINTIFDGYEEYKGDIQYRKQGSIIAFEDGESITYGLYNAQERGVLFIGPGEKVYSGMVVGQTGKAEDVEVNVCKTKHLSNTRSSGSDDALRLVPKKVMSLEQCMDFIDTDELLEVTPKNLRIRKKILDPTLRKRAALRKQQ